MVESATDASSHIDADAFKRLYPEHHFQTFLQHFGKPDLCNNLKHNINIVLHIKIKYNHIAVRPDGRLFDQSRPATISYDVVTTANSSALVKLGSTTALAGIKLEIMAAPDETPTDGQILVHVEMPPICSSSTRPGRQQENALILTEQLTSLLHASNIVDCSQLCIDQGKTVWAVYVDVYILDADGCLYDACLMAIIGALHRLETPQQLSTDENGIPQPRVDGTTIGNNEKKATKKVFLSSVPLSSTFCLHHPTIHKENNEPNTTFLIMDPTHDEESVTDAIVTFVLDEDGTIVRMHTWMNKEYGREYSHINEELLRICHEAAKKRTHALRTLMLHE